MIGARGSREAATRARSLTLSPHPFVDRSTSQSLSSALSTVLLPHLPALDSPTPPSAKHGTQTFSSSHGLLPPAPSPPPTWRARSSGAPLLNTWVTRRPLPIRPVLANRCRILMPLIPMPLLSSIPAQASLLCECSASVPPSFARQPWLIRSAEALLPRRSSIPSILLATRSQKHLCLTSSSSRNGSLPRRRHPQLPRRLFPRRINSSSLAILCRRRQGQEATSTCREIITLLRRTSRRQGTTWVSSI